MVLQSLKDRSELVVAEVAQTKLKRLKVAVALKTPGESIG
jgi:hypothetical protein